MYSPKFKPWSLARATRLSPGKPNPAFLLFADLYGPIYVRTFMGLRAIRTKGVEHLIQAHRDARAGKSRFLIAFRHPGDNDPQALFHTLSTLLQPAYRKAGLPKRPGTLFLASAEIPLWGGPVVAWVLQGTGIVPVSHGVMDRQNMETILQSMTASPVPVALAPEGQVSYFSRAMPELDDGTAQLCLWAAQRLQSKGESMAYHILPVGVRYHFDSVRWGKACRFLEDTEALVGLNPPASPALYSLRRLRDHQAQNRPDYPQALAELRKRLEGVWDAVLHAGERHYQRAYGYKPLAGQPLDQRSLSLAWFATNRAESQAGKRGSGDLRQRVMYLRHHVMDLSFADAASEVGQSDLDQRLASRAASEAYWLHRHLEFGDIACYVDSKRLLGFQDLDGAIESLQNLSDYAYRLVGGSFGSRRRYFRKEIEIRFGPPVSAEAGQGSRKAALETLRSRLLAAYSALLDA